MIRSSLLSLLLVLSFACQALNPQVRSSEYPAVPLVKTHDAYVLGDEALADDAQLQFLQDSLDLLDLLMSRPSLSREQLAESARPVVDRYDAYLDADLSLGFRKRNTLRRTSILARDLAGLPPHVSR
ncbi:MAG: hypothetical protein GY716_16150 [bacterium]|nr:hypothetical protein [bacterium]